MCLVEPFFFSNLLSSTIARFTPSITDHPNRFVCDLIPSLRSYTVHYHTKCRSFSLNISTFISFLLLSATYTLHEFIDIELLDGQSTIFRDIRKFVSGHKNIIIIYGRHFIDNRKQYDPRRIDYQKVVPQMLKLWYPIRAHDDAISTNSITYHYFYQVAGSKITSFF